jgi:thymidine kinase
MVQFLGLYFSVAKQSFPTRTVLSSDVRDYGYALNIVVPNSGWIEAICGPMFSGKTEELIRRLKRSVIARRGVQVFKPRIDNRYSASEIVTHCNLRMASKTIDSVQEIIDRLDSETQVVGIDEAHFFGEPLVEVATHLADSGMQVIVAGLDRDYMGRPFPPMPHLLALAESITKTLAICIRCGAPAKHTQRLVESEELIFVGAVDSYEARCRHCFEPGIPRQETLPFSPHS